MIDPLSQFDPQRETTLFLMSEVQKRGHLITCFTLSQIFYHLNSLYGEGEEIKIFGIGKKLFYKIIRKKRFNLAKLDAIFLRKDPPFDLSYLHHLYLLNTIRDQVFMVNDPLGIMTASEKLFPLRFERFIPKTCVTKNYQELLRFSKNLAHGVILKPINSSGGRGIFHIKSDQSNLKVAFETLSNHQAEYIVCQEYLPSVKKGDKRVVLLDGEILGYFLRVPQKGDHRANLHSGGALKKCSLTKREIEIASELAADLNRLGLSFVGLDFIGEKLTEINVTSPMGIREINQTLGGKSEKKVIDFVEERAKVFGG